MSAAGPALLLLVMVAVVLYAGRSSALSPLFRWLPTPLWCYALPMIACAAGWLPAGHPSYRQITDLLLPVALAMLLFGVDIPRAARAGAQALLSTAAGALAITIGTAVGVWLLQNQLPPQAWKGAGTLAATWTGGSMNLLALRSILETPEEIFAPLVIVDVLVAYGWMALLIAVSGHQRVVDRWLKVPEDRPLVPVDPGDDRSEQPFRWLIALISLVLSVALAAGTRIAAAHLPQTRFVSSASGWAVLLVTTIALGLSFLRPVRQVGTQAERIGYPLLYLVLAAIGAQTSMTALRETPQWIGLGIGVAAVHGIVLLILGRMLRIPLAILSTASQANVGGVVSAPLVGAVYHKALAPVGLVLAIGCNAVGTYLGLLSASLARLLMNGG